MKVLTSRMCGSRRPAHTGPRPSPARTFTRSWPRRSGGASNSPLPPGPQHTSAVARPQPFRCRAEPHTVGARRVRSMALRPPQDLAGRCGLPLYDAIENIGELVAAGLCWPDAASPPEPLRPPCLEPPARPLADLPEPPAGPLAEWPGPVPPLATLPSPWPACASARGAAVVAARFAGIAGACACESDARRAGRTPPRPGWAEENRLGRGRTPGEAAPGSPAVPRACLGGGAAAAWAADPARRGPGPDLRRVRGDAVDDLAGPELKQPEVETARSR